MIYSPPRQGVLLTYSSLYSCPYWLPVLIYLMLGECWALPAQIVIYPHHRAVVMQTTAPVIPVGRVTTAGDAAAFPVLHGIGLISPPWW